MNGALTATRSVAIGSTALSNNLSATNTGPSYVRLDRGGLDDLYDLNPTARKQWHNEIHVPRWDMYATAGRPATALISTGAMVHTALKVADSFPNARVLDVFQIKPLKWKNMLKPTLENVERIVTIEEHQLAGGLGSIVAEMLADEGSHVPMLRIGVPDSFTFDMGGREIIQQKYGLDVDSIVKRIQKWKAKLS